MTPTVYVPLDGSEHAQRALPVATAIAARRGGELVLLATPWPDTAAETVSSYLSAQAAFLDWPARSWLVLDRTPADAIGVAAAEPDSLVVMTTRGRGVASRGLLGSVTEEVVRTCVAPVLFVGPGIRAGWELADEPLVLAGLDGSTPSVAAAHAAGDLAASIGARVRVVEVLRPSDILTVGEFPRGDLELLEVAAAELSRRGVPADHEMVDGYDAADTLANKAAAEHAAVISVASHGRTGLARLVLGSIAMKTIRRAACPVLVTGPAVHRHETNGATVRASGEEQAT
jgi:nucleotide-binding universal stress UspA family protein